MIDFGDFVRSLNVFHPNASQEDKINCKLKNYVSAIFRLYKLRVLMPIPKLGMLLVVLSVLIIWYGHIFMQFHLLSMIWMVRGLLNVKRYVVTSISFCNSFLKILDSNFMSLYLPFKKVHMACNVPRS